MYCLICRDSVMIRLVCYDRYNPLHYVYDRLRQVGTNSWHVHVIVWAPATVCGGLLRLVLLELCCVGGLEMKMVLRVGMFQLMPVCLVHFHFSDPGEPLCDRRHRGGCIRCP